MSKKITNYLKNKKLMVLSIVSLPLNIAVVTRLCIWYYNSKTYETEETLKLQDRVLKSPMAMIKTNIPRIIVTDCDGLPCETSLISPYGESSNASSIQITPPLVKGSTHLSSAKTSNASVLISKITPKERPPTPIDESFKVRPGAGRLAGKKPHDILGLPDQR